MCFSTFYHLNMYFLNQIFTSNILVTYYMPRKHPMFFFFPDTTRRREYKSNSRSISYYKVLLTIWAASCNINIWDLKISRHHRLVVHQHNLDLVDSDWLVTQLHLRYAFIKSLEQWKKVLVGNIHTWRIKTGSDLHTGAHKVNHKIRFTGGPYHIGRCIVGKKAKTFLFIQLLSSRKKWCWPH